MFTVKAFIDGKPYWRVDTGTWHADESKASTFTRAEAERQIRIVNANNRFLDREDQVEPFIDGASNGTQA